MIKRSILAVTRRKTKTIIFLIFLFVVLSLVLCSISIKNATIESMKKVKKLLELNKATYLKSNTSINETIDLEPLLKDKIKKYKVINKELKYKIIPNSKEKVKGNLEIWDSILDNILSNMVRYAKKEVIITLNDNNIIFYNDGEHINKNLINKIFD